MSEYQNNGRSIGSFTLLVFPKGENWIAFARFNPNPLASAWTVCSTQTEAIAQCVVWANQIEGVLTEELEQDLRYAEGVA